MKAVQEASAKTLRKGHFQKFLVVMPSFNNHETILHLIAMLSTGDLHLLVVDDGSEKPVSELVGSERRVGVTIVRHHKNKGKGAALKTGFSWAKEHGFTHAITVDADGQHSTTDIARISAASRENPQKIILGRRDMDSLSAGFVPKSSRFGRDFSDFWIAIEAGKRVFDSQSGLRCYPLKGLPDQACWTTHYDFEVEILTRWIWLGREVESLNVEVFYPKLRFSSFRPFLDNARISWLHTRLCGLRLLGSGIFFNIKPPNETEIAGAGLVSWLLRHFGHRFCYFFLPVVAACYWGFSRDAKNNLVKFYRHFGVTGLRARFLTFRNVLAFAFSILDRAAFGMGIIRPEVFSHQHFLGGEEGWVILGAHFGDWSFAGSAFAAKHQRPVLIMIDQGINPKLQSIAQRGLHDRVIFGDLSGDKLATILTCKDVIERGGFVCLMADRRPAHLDELVRVNFMGKPAYLAKGVFRLAKAFGRPVRFFNCCRVSQLGRSHYRLVSETIWDGEEDIDEVKIAERYAKVLENAVRVSPQNWFNFNDFWSVDRVSSQTRSAGSAGELEAHA
ncbi:MAG: glycosyltransferase [Proteobacteria bacterium]|nr:glycosyltransferase [Pseudomonadota bacterium]